LRRATHSLDRLTSSWHGLADPQAVPVDHEQKGVIANAVAPLLCRLKQAIDLRTVQKILRALMRVGRSRLTLYLCKK
jgi:hypothetical protein